MLGLFRKRITARTHGVPPASVKMDTRPAGTALYVDTENLQSSAQALVETIIGQWPEGTPPLSHLNLYVRADRVSLWDAWASSRFPRLTVTVTGIQHFTSAHSKNSADIAIAIDAVADFVMGTTQFVAVMSDDSDFMPLYSKLKRLGGVAIPFLWVMTDRTKMKAAPIEHFFPMTTSMWCLCQPRVLIRRLRLMGTRAIPRYGTRWPRPSSKRFQSDLLRAWNASL